MMLQPSLATAVPKINDAKAYGSAVQLQSLVAEYNGAGVAIQLRYRCRASAEPWRQLLFFTIRQNDINFMTDFDAFCDGKWRTTTFGLGFLGTTLDPGTMYVEISLSSPPAYYSYVNPAYPVIFV